MQNYRILYFRDNQLVHSEALGEGDGDLLDAIDRATGNPARNRAEIWSDRGRVGIVESPPEAAARRWG